MQFILKTYKKGKGYRISVIILIKILSNRQPGGINRVSGSSEVSKHMPMGWNSWNTFKNNINESLIRDIADAFEKDGYKEAGYKYIIIDDCWSSKQRDKEGNLVPDPAKFPGGMKALVDYVHSKGLKIGIYGCAGTRTCADFPGSKGFEMQDAKLFASWGIDYLKYDWCNTSGLNAEVAYATMRDALYAAGRPVVFGICDWGDNQPWLWGKKTGQLWRISGDIAPCFDCVIDHGSYKDWGVMKVVYMRKDIRKYAGPDGWNDFDMMEVGKRRNSISITYGTGRKPEQPERL